MAIGKALQTNFTSGVLDPKLAAREDITFYYNALKDALNLLVTPQGGAYARPGMQWVSRLAKQLVPVDMTGAIFTAPHGGETVNLHDGIDATKLTTVDDLAAVNPFVVAHVAFPADISVYAIDVINYHLTSGSLKDQFFVQFSLDNISWFNVGESFDIDASDRTRRRNEGSVFLARYFRIVRIGSTAIAAKVNVGELKFWTESSDLSAARLVPFAYSTDEAYMMVATGGNLAVFTGAESHGSIGIEHTSEQLPIINWTQSLDTLLLFHRDVRTPRIFRQGASDEFDCRPAPFTNIPNYDYGAGVGGVDEVQVLNVGGFENGREFTLLLEGKRTTIISTGASATEMAANIQIALRALSNTSATGITATNIPGTGIEIVFSGDDGKQPWDEITCSVSSGNLVIDVSRTTEGEYPGEVFMSDARGWPRCGLFHQARLHLGGVTSLPDAHLMSTITDNMDFDTKRDDDTKGLFFRADTDQVGAIYNIVAGRHLTLFTNDGEFYYTSEAIKEDNAPKLTTRSGSKEGMRIHEVDGALMFVQGVKDDRSPREIGTSVREFIYEETRQSYDANLVSKLSSHLIKNPVDVALRKAVDTDDADILLLVNNNGSGTAYTVLRSDSVNAFLPFATRAGDMFLAVGVDKKRRVYFVTERIVNGVANRFIEIWNKNLLLDCGDIVAVTAETVSATATGQSAFNWSFVNPADPASIGVRLNGGRLAADQYAVDLLTKTVTLSASLAMGIKGGDQIRIASMIDRVSGLAHLNGETLDTVIDGTQGGRFTVSSGSIVFDRFADTEIQYGFDYEVSGKLMPLRVPESESLAGEKVRVVNARFELFETGGLEIRANNGRWQEVELIKSDDDVLDRSTAELLYTGSVEKRGLLGFAVGAPLEFRRPGPTPFNILGVTREVSL